MLKKEAAQIIAGTDMAFGNRPELKAAGFAVEKIPFSAILEHRPNFDPIGDVTASVYLVAVVDDSIGGEAMRAVLEDFSADS